MEAEGLKVPEPADLANVSPIRMQNAFSRFASESPLRVVVATGFFFPRPRDKEREKERESEGEGERKREDEQFDVSTALEEALPW